MPTRSLKTRTSVSWRKTAETQTDSDSRSQECFRCVYSVQGGLDLVLSTLDSRQKNKLYWMVCQELDFSRRHTKLL